PGARPGPPGGEPALGHAGGEPGAGGRGVLRGAAAADAGSAGTGGPGPSGRGPGGRVVTGQPIRVLVVEVDPVAADAHVMYVGRVPGFVAVGKAHTGGEARRMLERTPVDLLLLDLHLPDVHGLQLA